MSLTSLKQVGNFPVYAEATGKHVECIFTHYFSIAFYNHIIC